MNVFSRWFLVLLGCLPRLFAGISESGGDHTLTHLHIPIQVAGYGSAFFEETARKFEQARPDVRVHLQGDARISEKVRVRVMAGDLPDATDAVLLYDSLIAAGHILDLAEALDGPNWEGDGRWRDSFLPGVLNRWSRPGGEVDPDERVPVYGIPFAHAVWTVFYDQALFAANGWSTPRTWDEFFVLCERIQQSGLAPLTLPGVYMRYGDAFLRAGHYNLVGPEVYAAYNRLEPDTRTDPRFIRAAEAVQRLTTQYLITGWEGMTHTAAQQAFLEGKSAMTISASWMISEMRGRIPERVRLGTFNLPVFADGIAPAATLQTQSAYYFLFRTGDAKRERAAVDFFRYLTSRERARAFVEQNEAPVALRTVPVDAYSPAMRPVAEMLAQAPATFDAAPPASASFQALLNQTMTDARHGLMTGRITPEQFGRRLEEAAANERARQSDPRRVTPHHAGKAALLVMGVLATAGLLLWSPLRRMQSRWKRRYSRARGAWPPGHGHTGSEALGRLRAPLGWGFVAPATALYAVFVLLPGGVALVWAFASWDGFGSREWTGWFNFRWILLESDTFWQALGNNAYLMLVPTLAVVPLALTFACLIHRGVWGAQVFRVVFLFPNLLGGVAATLLWMSAYEPHHGLVNSAFAHLAAAAEWIHAPASVRTWLAGFQGFAWLSQSNLYHSLLPIYLWSACGFNLILYLAAMEGIPAELYEAAEIEGASRVRQFFSITLPMIRDVLVISAVFIVIAGLNAFEMIWILTSQDPASGTHTLSTWMVSMMFREFQVGRATAVAVIMLVLVLVASAALMRAFRRESTDA